MTKKIEIEKQDTILTARATIEPVELDDATAKRLLRVINRKHARTTLELEDVFLFPGVLSTQAIDYYGTRMTARTMRNYRADVRAGIALMNSHRTGGWSSEGELPVGRIFEGELEGDALDMGDVGFDDQVGQMLQEWSYMLRGIQVTDVKNDDLIRAIEGGTTKDKSISFSTHPDGRFICSICGNDYYGWSDDPEQRCAHIAFVTYEGESGKSERCFVWVENARAFEGSLVYKGATPGAMVRKAQEHADEIPVESLGWLEERYQVRLLDVSAHPAAQSRKQPEEEVRMDREQVLTAIKGLVGEERLAELAAIEDDAKFVGECLRAMTGAHEANISEATANAKDLEARLAELEPDAELGRAYKADLVNVAVKARVQAQGNEFDAEKWRSVLMDADLEFIKMERDTWKERAAEVLKSGRQVHGDLPDEPVQAPAAAYQ